MSISLKNIKRSGSPKPPIDLIYATGGVGKTSFAAGAPDPIFLQTEDGLGKLEMPTFGMLTSYNDVMSAIIQLIEQPHDYRTAVVDSIGWLEPLINKQCCLDNNWKTLDDPGYGKGQIAAKQYWRDFLDGLAYLRNHRNMGILLLSHADAKNVEHPEVDDFGRFQPKLENKHAVAMVIEFCDDVFYMAYKVSTTLSDARDKNSRKVAVGGSKRYFYTAEKPTFAAKNRWSMPDMIILPDDPTQMFVTVAKHTPYYKAMLDGTLNAGEEVQLPKKENEIALEENKTETQTTEQSHQSETV